MSQSYSVQIYQQCFNITVKEKQICTVDEGYCSDPESVMEKKRQANMLEVQLREQGGGEQVLDARAAQGLREVRPSPHPPPALKLAQAKVKKKKDCEPKNRAALLSSGQAGHKSKMGPGRLPQEVHSSRSRQKNLEAEPPRDGLSFLSSIRGQGRAERKVANLAPAAAKGGGKEKV